MNNKMKKSIAAFITGAFLLGGLAAPLVASAAQSNLSKPAVHQRKMDPEKVAQRLADNFGVNKAEIEKYQANGTSMKDIAHAAFLSYASGKSFAQVMDCKTADKSWKQVTAELGINQESIKTAKDQLQAKRLHDKLGIDSSEALSLLQQGYSQKTVAAASLLAKHSGKPASEVLALKTKDNSWRDVAKTLNINEDALKADLKKLRSSVPHGKWKQFKAEKE